MVMVMVMVKYLAPAKVSIMTSNDMQFEYNTTKYNYRKHIYALVNLT